MQTLQRLSPPHKNLNMREFPCLFIVRNIIRTLYQQMLQLFTFQVESADILCIYNAQFTSPPTTIHCHSCCMPSTAKLNLEEPARLLSSKIFEGRQSFPYTQWLPHPKYQNPKYGNSWMILSTTWHGKDRPHTHMPSGASHGVTKIGVLDYTTCYAWVRRYCAGGGCH